MLQATRGKVFSTKDHSSNLPFNQTSKKCINDLSLSTKMRLGYGIAFSVALLGIVAGVLTANRQVQKALYVYEEAVEDIENISTLKSDFIELTYHKQELVIGLENSDILTSDTLKAELLHFIEDSEEFAASWQALVTSEEFQEDDGSERVSEGELEVVDVLMQEYDADVNEYLTQIANLRQTVNPSQLEPDQILQLQRELQQLDQTDFILNLENFIDTITDLSQAARVEHQAGEAILIKAMRMQLIILLGSILVSGLLGLSIMHLVSRIVLTPIQEVTEVAQQSIREANFDLKVPISSQDETGILADTFNSYMAFVKQTLAELEQTNQHLQDTLKELNQAQAQMIQSEKMSSLGQLVAGVAHEINNPINFIHGNLHYVQQYIDDTFSLIKLYQQHYPAPVDDIKEKADIIELDFVLEDLPKILSSMKVGTDRIRNIVLSLRNFSRLDESELKAVVLHEGIDSTLTILNHRLKADFNRPEIQIVKAYDKLPLIKCYAGPLNQVFMNILANAIDALDEKQMQLTEKEKAEFSPQITVTTTLVDQSWVQIAIADNGMGIPADIQKNIFEPFFTTKAVGKGTGMGMSISYQIICEKHGGHIKCLSSPGKGTEFVILLPLQPSLVLA